VVFKFTLLGLEFSKNESACADVNIEKEKMAKKKSSKKQLAQQKKFKKYSKICHKEPTKQKYYNCMSNALTKKNSKKK